jgi:hypothetical protein
MNKTKKSTLDESYESAKKRDAALARALSTPHKPHKPLKTSKKVKKPAK